MNQSAVLTLAPKLAEAVTARKALIDAGALLTDFAVMSLDKQGAVLAADLQAAMSEPQSIKPWSPFNGGQSA